MGLRIRPVVIALLGLAFVMTASETKHVLSCQHDTAPPKIQNP